MRFQTIVFVLTISIVIGGAHSPVKASSPETSGENYSRLLQFIALEDLQDPLVLFEDHQGDFDRALNQENIAYLNQNKALLRKIKTRLKGEDLHWKLAASSKRRLVVPERRPEYAALFQRYCRKSIDYLLQRLQSPTPYAEITTLSEPLPLRRVRFEAGVKAYLVHNIADEYIEEYVFFNKEDQSTKIKIKLSNRVFSGIIGSYSSDLVIGENSSFEFIHEPFTLWQNSAENPLNVFITPIEETLHILLRGATETAIRSQLQQDRPRKLMQVEGLIKDWMAVEEAIVGGVVAQLMPEIFSRFLNDPLEESLSEALAQRDQHAQYRYLGRGIQVVENMGLKEAIKLYKSDPMYFRDLVRQPDLAAAS